MKGDICMETQYIGARYVPKFYENSHDPSSMEWESNKGYEALTVVTWNDDTYTSKKPVPSGIGNPSSNPQYWAKTGNFNAALEGLQEEVSAIKNGELNNNVLSVDKFTEETRNILFDNSKLIFVKNDTNRGNCTIVITKQKKVLMFDSGSNGMYSDIKAELDANEISHVDYYLLSHYHPDHYANIDYLINDGYFDNSTVCYLPRRTNSADWNANDDYVRGLLSGMMINVYSSSEPLIVDNWKFTFFNGDASDYAYYESQSIPAANEYSVCTYAECSNFTLLLTADIEGEGINHNANNFKKVDVLQIPHHGARMTDDIMQMYMSTRPDFGVVFAKTDYYTDASDYMHSSNSLKYFSGLGIPFYITGFASLYIGVGDDVYNSMPNHMITAASAYKISIPIYVDKGRNVIGDGSINKPFTFVEQALAFINSIGNIPASFVINIVNEYNSNEVIYIESDKVIEIVGTVTGDTFNVKFNRIEVVNSTVLISNVECVANDSDPAVHANRGAIISLNNVKIIGDATSQSGDTNGVGIMCEHSSNVVGSNVTISNRNVVFNECINFFQAADQPVR